MRKKKPDYWSKVNRDLEELPCVNDVSAYLVSASLGRIPFLWLCISALLLFYLNCFSVCSPTCSTMSLITNFVPGFIVFASLKHLAFKQGARVRAILLLASGGSVSKEPGGLWSMGSQRVGRNCVTNTFTFTSSP